MLLKIVCVIFVINQLTLISEAIPVHEYNETRLLSSINFKLGKLRAAQGKLLDKIEKIADMLSLRAEGKCVTQNQVDKEQYNNTCVESVSSGALEILLPKFSSEPFKVACDADTQGGGWTIIMRRMDGSVNFYRNWTEYKHGFGDLDGELFLGLDKIHALTAYEPQKLLVVLEDFEGNERFELYDYFIIGDEDEEYNLEFLSRGTGTAGDSLFYHHNTKFSTFDRDNDNSYRFNCAEEGKGGWWYKDCQYTNSKFFSNLAGIYNDNSYKRGVNWSSFRGDNYSLKRAVMMIRPIFSKMNQHHFFNDFSDFL